MAAWVGASVAPGGVGVAAGAGAEEEATAAWAAAAMAQKLPDEHQSRHHHRPVSVPWHSPVGGRARGRPIR